MFELETLTRQLLATTGDAAALAGILYSAIERYKSEQINAHETLIVLRCCRDGVYHRWEALLKQVPEVAYFWDHLRLQESKQ